MTYLNTDAEAPPATKTARFWTRPALRPVLWLAAGHLVAAVAIGLTWLALAPKTTAYVVPTGTSSTVIIPAESESQVAGDARFLLLSLTAGIILAVIAWRFRSIRGPLALAVLGAGGLLCSLLATLIGSTLASGQRNGAPQSVIHPPLTLHATQMLWAQAFIAVLAYVVIAGMTSDPDLRHAAGESTARSTAGPPETSRPWPAPPVTD
jgi:hypothetical protein